MGGSLQSAPVQRVGIGIALAAVAALTGCVGAHSRDEFETLIHSRGGGASNLGVQQVLDTLVDRVGGDAAIRRATFGFGETYGSLQVSVSTSPLEADDFAIYGTQVRYHEPVRNPDEMATVPASRIARLDVEALADEALAALDAYVTTMTVTPALQRIQLTVESARASGYAVFDLDGTFQEFVRL